MVRPRPRVVSLALALLLGIAVTPSADASAATSEPAAPATALGRPLHLVRSAADRIFAGPARAHEATLASPSCEPVVQEAFRWVSAAVMANGLPIIAYTSRRPYVLGGDADEDGLLHPRVAPYLSETAVARPVVLDDPAIIGRSGWDNESAVDIATNGPGGLILVTFIDPLRHRVVVRRSTDLGATWSALEKLSTLANVYVDPYDIRGHYHQLYYDAISGLFYYSYAFGNTDQIKYVTSADGITWSPIHYWSRFYTSNGSNPFQSRIARFFRTKAGTWIAYGNLFGYRNSDFGVSRFGNGVCDTLTCWPTQQVQLWKWPGVDGSPPSPAQDVNHTPGTAFYLPASSTPDRIHLLFGATALTAFRSLPNGHLLHWWSDDDGRNWRNENGIAGGQGFDTSIVGAADAETPVPEPTTGPLADIDAAWVPSFGGGSGQLVVWGVEGNHRNNAPGLDVSVFGDGSRDQTRVQGTGGYKTCSNTPPKLVRPADQRIYLADGLDLTVTFDDPDIGQTWSGSVDFGDGTGFEAIPSSSEKRLTLRHRYAKAGSYGVTLAVTDSAGANDVATFIVTVVPRRGFVFVHGINANYRDRPFRALMSRVEIAYVDATGEPMVHYFQYHQDRGNRTNGVCEERSLLEILPYDATLEYPVDLPKLGEPPYCDSNDDVGANGLFLERDIRDLATRWRADKITIIANSMGGAIVRAYLAYAAARQSATGRPDTLDLVDGVVFLQSVHQGAYGATARDFFDEHPNLQPIRRTVADAVRNIFGYEPERPAIKDLSPGSAMIRYVNRPEHLPTALRYINARSDIRLQPAILLMGYRFPARLLVGDYLLLPGDSNPTKTPEGGGAGFLPSIVGVGRSSGQWSLRSDQTVYFELAAAQLPALIATQPESHAAFGGKLNEICVQTLKGKKRLDVALFEAIRALDAPTPDLDLLEFGTLESAPCS